MNLHGLKSDPYSGTRRLFVDDLGFPLNELTAQAITPEKFLRTHHYSGKHAVA